jgi:hypothetical protein
MKAITLISLLTLTMSCASSKVDENRSRIKNTESQIKERINSIVNYKFRDILIDRKR